MKYTLKDNSGRTTVSVIRSIDGSGDRMVVSLNGQDVIKDHKDPKSGRMGKKKILGATSEQLGDLLTNPQKWGDWSKTITSIPGSEVKPVKKKGRPRKKKEE